MNSEYRIKALTAAGLLFLLLTGGWLASSYHRAMIKNAELTISLVGQDRVEHVASWRRDQAQFARTMAQLLSRNIGTDSGRHTRISGISVRFQFLLRQLEVDPSVENLLIVAHTGEIIASRSPVNGNLDNLIPSLNTLMESQEVLITDPYVDQLGEGPRFSVMAPIPIACPSEEHRDVSAALVVVHDAKRSLFHVLDKLPLPISSQETVLASFSGDSISFVNPLQLERGAAQRLPVSPDSDLPMLQAVRGGKGMVQGRDYRGVHVIAFVDRIEESNWYLVTKVDRSDVVSTPNRVFLFLIALVLLACILLVSTAMLHTGRVLRSKEKLEKDALRKKVRDQNLHEATFNQVAVGVAHISPEGLLLRVNHSLCSITGNTEEELVGTSLASLTHSDDAKLETELIDELICGKRFAYTQEKRLLHNSGSEIWVRQSVSLVRDEKGIPEFSVAIIEDFEEKKRALLALQDSEARYEELMQSVPMGMFATTPEGKAVETNALLAQMLGFDNTEEALEHYSDLGDTLYAHESDHQTVLETLSTNGVLECFEFEGLRKDRSQIWMEVDAVLTRGENHQPLVKGFLRDVTRRKVAERDRELLLMGIEQLTESVIITDKEGSIQYVNPAFLQHTGFTQKEVIGKNPRILKSGKMDPQVYIDMWQCLTSGKVWSGEVVNKRKDGSFYNEESTISPVRDAKGDVTGYIAVKRDVTREVELEQQLRQSQKMEAVGQLAGGVAHDFNNVLQAIMGYSHMLIEELESDSETAEFALEISNSAERAGALTKQLLAFSRKQSISPKNVNLNDSVDSLLKMLRRLVNEDIELKWVPGGKLPWTLIDVEQLNQVLVNLVVNARDAIDGSGCIQLRSTHRVLDESFCARHPGSSPGEHVVLEVEDTGCGMDDEVRLRVFEPFFTTKAEGKGTGLGLATVYGIVKQNKGYIDITSTPGSGSTFTLYFPALERNPQEKEEATGRGEELPRGNAKILLVEDEAPLLRLASRMLVSLGYSVKAVQDPLQARQVAFEATPPFQLLLTDVIMPELNGLELGDQLQSDHKELKVLLMSGYTDDVLIQRGVHETRHPLIYKPFALSEIATVLRDVLDDSR